MKQRYVNLLLGCLLLLCIQCKKTVDTNEIPSYLYIDEINLQTQSGEGTARHDIKDAWVYVTGQAIGVFELPARVPILADGNPEIWIYAGVKKDGISSTRIKYPFYEQFTTASIYLERGKIDTISPTVNYLSPTYISVYEESFDDAGIDFQADPLSEGTLTYETAPGNVYEGSGSALMELNSSQSFSKFVTLQSFPLPKQGKNVYLELHYKTNNTLTVGFQAITGTDITHIDNLHLRPTNGVWKKVYVDFTELVSQTSASTFKFYVKIVKDEGNTTVYNLIDNFKVVYAK